MLLFPIGNFLEKRMAFTAQYDPTEFNGVIRDMLARTWPQPGVTIEHVHGSALHPIDPAISAIASMNNAFGTVNQDWSPPLADHERYPNNAFYDRHRQGNGIFYSAISRDETTESKERTTLVFQVSRESEAENQFMNLLTLEQLVRAAAQQRIGRLTPQDNRKEEWIIPIASESKGYLPGEPHIRVLHIVFSSQNQVQVTLYESKSWLNGFMKPSAGIFNTVETELHKLNPTLVIKSADWYLSELLLGNIGQAQWNRIDCGVYCVLFTERLVKAGGINRDSFSRVDIGLERCIHKRRYSRMAEGKEFEHDFDPATYYQVCNTDVQDKELTEAELAALREFFYKVLTYFQKDDMFHSVAHRLERLNHFYRLLETIAQRQLDNYEAIRATAPRIFGFGEYASLIQNSPVLDYYNLERLVKLGTNSASVSVTELSSTSALSPDGGVDSTTDLTPEAEASKSDTLIMPEVTDSSISQLLDEIHRLQTALRAKC